MADLQLRLTPLEEVFLTIARKARWGLLLLGMLGTLGSAAAAVPLVSVACATHLCRPPMCRRSWSTRRRKGGRRAWRWRRRGLWCRWVLGSPKLTTD